MSRAPPTLTPRWSAGVDWIVHLPGYANLLGDPPERFLISQESAEQAARQGTVVVTTVAATELFQPAPEILAALRTVQRQNLARLQMAHAKLLIGSDVFMGTALAEAEGPGPTWRPAPARTVCACATRGHASALFPQRRLGCFEPGCEASFLLLLGDPLEDLSHLDQPLLRVSKGGCWTQLARVVAASSLASASTADPPKKAAGGKRPARRKQKQAAKPATSAGHAKANRPASAKTR